MNASCLVGILINLIKRWYASKYGRNSAVQPYIREVGGWSLLPIRPYTLYMQGTGQERKARRHHTREKLPGVWPTDVRLLPLSSRGAVLPYVILLDGLTLVQMLTYAV